MNKPAWSIRGSQVCGANGDAMYTASAAEMYFYREMENLKKVLQSSIGLHMPELEMYKYSEAIQKVASLEQENSRLRQELFNLKRKRDNKHTTQYNSDPYAKEMIEEALRDAPAEQKRILVEELNKLRDK